MPIVGKKQLTPDEVQALNDTFRDTEGDESEEGRREHARTRAKLRRLTHIESCSTCQAEEALRGSCMVEVDVPLDSCKKPIQINNKEYFGLVTVYACRAQWLTYMIDQNRQEAQRATQGQDKTLPYMGLIQDRARQVQES